MFSTAVDNQPAVDIHVLQGERQMALDNKTLGRFQLGDIPPAPRGVPQIEVTFDIDANGIVNVSAKDLGTGKSQKITISGGSSLSDEEIDRMIKEAEDNRDADLKRREEVDLRNEADALVFQTKKAMDDLKDSITDDEKANAEKLIKELEEALKGEDLEKIKSKKENLEKSAQELAAKVYQQAQEKQAQEESDESSNDKDDTVMDADFEEKN